MELRFYKRKAFFKLTKSEKVTLTSWRSSNPETFQTSKRKTIGINNNENRKRHKSDHDKKKGGKGLTDAQLAQIQSLMDKKVNTLKYSPEKKVKFKEDNTNNAV